MIADQEVTFEQLQEAYIKGQRVFTKIEIAAKDDHLVISGINLASAEFVACWFHSVKFFEVDLTGVRFIDCNLKCTVFEGCDLTNTLWRDSAVCSIAWRECTTANIQAVGLEAYGGNLADAQALVSYATDNLKTC
ncbi:MAG: pentapeptide repeat-containing protein [Alphaproteobacteria bacterium]|nr:pentapeptide repeat-containing protein [Alphaproteobacteria bacterium]